MTDSEAASAASGTMEGNASPASEVRGLVDNATANRIYGWAWDASYPAYRMPVELRLAGEVVATALADHVRPDLAANGVGDGCHAFEFALLPEWFDRRGELAVTALGGDGKPYPVMVRLRRPDDSQVATTLQRAVEAMAAEQEAIRAEHATLRARAELLPEAEAVAAIGRSNDALNRRLDELELWIARLDARLAGADRPKETVNAGRLDAWQVVLVAVLVGAACAALAVTIAISGG